MNLITRSDFDGLTCAVLLKEVEIIETITFAHPKDVQDGAIQVTKNDILTNMPYHPSCGMWFDHHSSEDDRSDIPPVFEGRFEIAPSCARVVYNHYKSHRFTKYEYLLTQVDKIDSAQLTVSDVTDPKGYVLLSYIMDPRTGLGRYHDYGISNKNLMYKMIDLLAGHSVDEILAMHDIRQRVKRYFEQEKEFKEMLLKTSRVDKNVVITDNRNMPDAPTGNRFLIYTLYPETNISVRILDGKQGNVAVAIGHSIFNRTSKTDVGALCAKYGGGGHRGAGTAQFAVAEADAKIKEMVEQMKMDG